MILNTVHCRERTPERKKSLKYPYTQSWLKVAFKKRPDFIYGMGSDDGNLALLQNDPEKMYMDL